MSGQVLTFPTRPMAALPTEAPWPTQGQWTYEDYLRLPDDGKRYEIIEGVLYVTNAPSFDHQYAVVELVSQLRNFVIEKKLGVVLTAPFEVHLPGIAKPVQPDVLFIAADRRPVAKAKFFVGAPDLVVEVVSPGTMRLDRSIKLNAYERAGVREYWLVDPRMEFVEVYVQGENGEFDLLGQFRAEEKVQSNVLSGLELVTGSLFAP